MNPFEERRASAQEIRDAVANRTIETADRSTLTKYSAWLCTPRARGEMAVGAEHEQVSELVRFHMLRTLMDEIEKRNLLTQRLVIALTIAALIVGIPQLWFAYKANKRAEIEQTTNKTTASENKSPTSALTLGQRQATNQAASPAVLGKTKTP